MQMLLDKFEYTLPETNIAPERGWLEDKFPLRWHIFRGEMWVSGSVCDSRSKVLNTNFNLGGTQPTLLYDFTSSLCGVTQGNPAKHKLGARFAQGWRKCFHVLSWYISFTYNIYIYSHTLYVYRLYHQSFSLNMLFVFKEQRFQNMSIQQLQNWEIKLHFSRKLRASPAQAKKMHLGEVRKGTPGQMITSLERKLAKYQRNLSTQRRRKGRQRIAVKERQKKARSDVMSRSSSSTSSSDSSDWKKSAQVHCCRKIEALVFLLANSMIVRQGMFFKYEKRRHAGKCVIWPILRTSFSENRHVFFLAKRCPGLGLVGKDDTCSLLVLARQMKMLQDVLQELNYLPASQVVVTLQGTNISLMKGLLRMIFLFPKWDMLVPRRVYVVYWEMFCCVVL